MDFKISKNGKQLIKEYEGLKLQAYECQAGKLTIGYGHTCGVKKGMVITLQEAERLLDEDLRGVQRYVNSLKVCRNINQFDALCSFVFNLGYSALGGSTLLKKIRTNRPMAEIQAEFEKWVYVRIDGRKMASTGLIRRRHCEAELFAAVEKV